MNKYEREKLQLRLLSLKKRRLAKTDSECLEMEAVILFSLQQFVKRAELDLRSTKLNFLLFLTQFIIFLTKVHHELLVKKKLNLAHQLWSLGIRCFVCDIHLSVDDVLEVATETGASFVAILHDTEGSIRYLVFVFKLLNELYFCHTNWSLPNRSIVGMQEPWVFFLVFHKNIKWGCSSLNKSTINFLLW